MTAGLMADVIAVKDGKEEDKEKAIATLIVGVKKVQETVAKHLVEMKAESLALKAQNRALTEKPEVSIEDWTNYKFIFRQGFEQFTIRHEK